MPTVRPLTLDLEGRPVSVYRNLTNGLFSVQYQGRVVAHLPEVTLLDVEFRVSEAGRQRVLRERCRNVHAYARGTFTTREQPGAVQGLSYNPYRAGHFYWLATQEPATRARALVLRGGRAYGELPAVEVGQPRLDL